MLKLKRLALIAALVVLAPMLALAGSGTITVKDGGGSSRTYDVVTDGSGNFVTEVVICDQSAAASCVTVSGNALSVSAAQSGTWNITNISGTITLPTGAATSALQTTGNTNLTTINTTLGSPFQAGGSLAANQSVNINQVAGSSASTAATGVLKVGVVGNTGAALDAAGQNVASPANELLIGGQFNTSPTTISSGNMSPLQLDSAGKLLIDCSANCGVAAESTTSGQVMSLIGAAVTTSDPSYTNAKTDAPSMTTTGHLREDLSSVAGTNISASGATASENPFFDGGRAQNAEATAVTNGQKVGAAFDLVGKLIVLPYANPENFENGTTAAITDTTSTAVIASAGGSLRHYVTQCSVSNSHATVGTFVKILDGASIIHEAFAAPAGGGFVASFPVPLRGTAATALNCQAVTTGTNFICSCSGYKGT